jgi:hypothetical protein
MLLACKISGGRCLGRASASCILFLLYKQESMFFSQMVDTGRYLLYQALV